METLLAVLGSSLVTALTQWALYFRKHKAEATTVVTQNDHQEIQNLNLIAKEWREAAQLWKSMADEYQAKSIDSRKRIEQLEEKVTELERALHVANSKISKLQNQ